jgi:hypothetical protein
MSLNIHQVLDAELAKIKLDEDERKEANRILNDLVRNNMIRFWSALNYTSL